MLTQTQLAELLTELGQPAYRAGQILDWIYKKRARSWDEMSNLPEPLRDGLAEKYPLRLLKHTLTKGSADTTRKFLLELSDGRYVETVLIGDDHLRLGSQYRGAPDYGFYFRPRSSDQKTR